METNGPTVQSDEQGVLNLGTYIQFMDSAVHSFATGEDRLRSEIEAGLRFKRSNTVHFGYKIHITLKMQHQWL